MEKETKNQINKIELELVNRELARRKFIDYCRYVLHGFEDIAYQGEKSNLIHHKIIYALERVERGECKRLMIFCPPGLGKSTISSKAFPSYCLGKVPERKIIVTSYGADLANDFGRKTKQLVESQLYKNVFHDFQLSKDKKEGGNRETSQGGGYYTAGAGGSITGKRANIIIIDDPVKDRQEADSPTIQKRNIDWRDSVLQTRLESQDDAVVLIMTRWNIYDLAGYLLKEEGEKREKIIIQGIDEAGNEIVRPGKRDIGYMQERKKSMLPANRAALYQQDPVEAMDSIFKRSYFKYYLSSEFENPQAIIKKDDFTWGFFCDPAFSTSSNADSAVNLILGIHKITKQFYLRDIRGGQNAPSRTISNAIAMINLAQMEGIRLSFIQCEESKINNRQTDFVENFKKELIRHSINLPFYTKEQKIKKEVRVLDVLEPKFTQGAIYFRSDVPDKESQRTLEDQLVQFPNGRHDDYPDVLGQGVEKLNTYTHYAKEDDRYASVSIDRDEYLY